MLEIVVNPAGASGKTLKKWKNIEPLFHDAHEEYRVHFSTLQKGIREIVSELTSRGEDTDLVIVGGDGTMNEAVNGIEDFEHTRLGFISCGSGNDLARSLGLPAKAEDCAMIILQKNTRRTIDLGEVIYHTRMQEVKREPVSLDGLVHRRFNISCGIGFDAAICARVQTSSFKKVLNQLSLGKLIYIKVAIETIAKTKRIPAVMTLDGIRHEFNQMLFAVGMNEQYEGGGFCFCPHASDRDGLMDFCIGDGVSQTDFFRIFPYAYSGSHLKFDGVHEKRGREAHIETTVPMWVHTDGEVACMSDHITVKTAEYRLKMLD